MLPISETELNAHVDGELFPERQALVEAWLAGDPAQAAQIRSWRRQNQALRAAMVAAVPALGVEGLADYGALPKAKKAKAAGEIAGYPILDFYLTNPVARASETMQRCSAELLHGEVFAEAAE